MSGEALMHEFEKPLESGNPVIKRLFQPETAH
jgi:hypothetical protein